MKKKNNETELLKSVIATKQELESASKNFEIAEEELIDYYSYQIKAYKSRLDYLIRQVRNKGIQVDMINNLELVSEDIKVI